MKIRQVRAELFHADGQSDGHDEVENFTNATKKEGCGGRQH